MLEKQTKDETRKKVLNAKHSDQRTRRRNSFKFLRKTPENACSLSSGVVSETWMGGRSSQNSGPSCAGRRGRRTPGGAVDISEIVNRIAPKVGELLLGSGADTNLSF